MTSTPGLVLIMGLIAGCEQRGAGSTFDGHDPPEVSCLEVASEIVPLGDAPDAIAEPFVGSRAATATYADGETGAITVSTEATGAPGVVGVDLDGACWEAVSVPVDVGFTTADGRFAEGWIGALVVAPSGGGGWSAQPLLHTRPVGELSGSYAPDDETATDLRLDFAITQGVDATNGLVELAGEWTDGETASDGVIETAASW